MMKKLFWALMLALVLTFALIPLASAANVRSWGELRKAVKSSGTVTLTWDAVCDDQSLGPIEVPEGVTVTIDLNGHKIDRDLSEPIDNGCVMVVKGSLTVNDSSAAGNGAITGGNSNYRYGGGGIRIERNGSVTLNGGAVSGNAADAGGGVYVNGGTFTMNGGSVSGNTINYRGGGGIYIAFRGNVIMNGGSISGNTAKFNHGGGVRVENGVFTMNGGAVSGNTTDFGNGGGGIYLNGSDATVKLNGGSINGNHAMMAGGVYLYRTGTLEINGCQITNNTAIGCGGGVYIEFYTDASQVRCTLGRNTQITGNTGGGSASDLYVEESTGARIMLADGADAPNGMKVGVITAAPPEPGSPIQISDASMKQAYADYFFADQSDECETAVINDVLYLTALPRYNITVTDNGNGTAAANKETAAAGNTVTLTSTPNAGYRFKQWQSDDVTVTGNTFVMPEKDVTVTAVFEENAHYAVTVGNDGYGTASADQTDVAFGKTVTLTATPNAGYRFKEWQSDDVTVTGNTFVMPEKDVTVKAIFEKDVRYAVTVTDDGCGTASADRETSHADETVTLTATPNAGYRFKEWQSDDVTVTGNTFVMPEKDVTVKAIFEADPLPPRTGDRSDPLIWLALLAVCGAVLADAAVNRKKSVKSAKQ